MAAGDDLREFLTSRRARRTPAQAGLPDYGGRRRVPGLRREEVAILAGMSAEYDKRLERGHAAGVSAAVLDGVSRALGLDEAEEAHLHELTRPAGAGTHRRLPAGRPQLTAGMQQTIDAMWTVPVFVQNGRLDAVATNRLGRALFSVMVDGAEPTEPPRPVNAARFVFCDPQARSFYRDWAGTAHQIVAILRAESGRSPDDRRLTDLVGELGAHSQEFRELWDAHDVVDHRAGTKSIRHPVVGDLDLVFQSMDLAVDRGLQMLVFSAAPGSRSDERLRLLADRTSSGVRSATS